MSRFRDIEIFVLLWNLQVSKFVTSSQELLHHASYTCAYSFKSLSPMKIKSDQILVCCMTNISNMFLAECWRLETNSRLFYDFIKITVQQDPTIFNDWNVPFWIVLYSPLQKMKNWNLGIFGYWLIGAGS